MTYRDMTFCDGAGGRCAKFKDCPRALTKEVLKKAHAWWNRGKAEGEQSEPPISLFVNAVDLDCYDAGRLTIEIKSEES